MSPGKPSYIGRFGGLTVPGTPVGAIVSIGLLVLCWLAIPLADSHVTTHIQRAVPPQLLGRATRLAVPGKGFRFAS